MTRFQALRLVVFARKRRMKMLAELKELQRQASVLRARSLLAGREVPLPEVQSRMVRPIALGRMTAKAYLCFNGHPIGQPDIAAATGLTLAQVKGTVRCLMTHGLIEKRRRGLYVKVET